MSFNLKSLGTAVLAASLFATMPALANIEKDSPMERRVDEPVAQETYAGSNDTMPAATVSYTSEEATPFNLFRGDRGRWATE